MMLRQARGLIATAAGRAQTLVAHGADTAPEDLWWSCQGVFA
jgi:hypothetical protein